MLKREPAKTVLNVGCEQYWQATLACDNQLSGGIVVEIFDIGLLSGSRLKPNNKY